ncbi:hypothetical protein ASE86_07615 [Sphingomonas sp. Leaf33]|uniref:hypothetical protein n=1 Tax=Sphingomonas sp. Leaf33 TaxID=1736215 RepID=UPI0006FC6B33|nr:hypothetical protein [Sphingomonas sp. Leaf33]KQN26025.1 hypothetical protein ASE86_07615 [Sphingomonas sp. Leaf33]
MRIKLSTILNVPAGRAWIAVRQPRLLDFVASPIQVFEPVDPPVLPDTWSDGRYLVRPRMFGLLPMGTQWIVISALDRGPAKYRLRDNGHGSLVRRWDHVITIEPIDAQRCRYTDEVEVSAGVLTPFVAGFAHMFYRHRQRRWRQLVASDFAPLSSGAAA